MEIPKEEDQSERRARHGIAIAFLILAIGAFTELNPFISIIGIFLSIIAIGLLIAYRKFFTKRQKRAIYSSIVLYSIITVIVIAGFVASTFNIIRTLITEGFSFVIPAQQINGLFNSLFPFFVLNVAASDGLCYYLFVIRLLHRVDHAIYLMVLLVSVSLRVLVLALTYSGSFPIPQQFQSYLSIVKIDFYDPYQFLLSMLASLIMGFLLVYVAVQISRDKVLRI